jgi:hypothetical protein
VCSSPTRWFLRLDGERSVLLDTRLSRHTLPVDAAVRAALPRDLNRFRPA